MIKKVDDNAAQALAQATPPQPQPVQRPENVPEKFWDASKGTVNTEALLKSYTELESARGKPADPPAGDPPKVDEAIKSAKLDASALQAEFAKDGKLSDASYEALKNAGFDKSVVDGYIAGQVALAQSFDAKAYAAAGTQEAYGKMVQWAATGLSAAEQEAFNTAVAGTEAQMLQAVTALKARYDAAMGSDPKLHMGGNESAQSGGFQSRAEVTQAMKDPRYHKDPAYRAEVERRIGLMTDW